MITFGIISAIFVIVMDIKLIYMGLKKIDPLTDADFVRKYALPGSFFEIGFIIWVYFNLTIGILAVMLLLSLSGLAMKLMKMDGHLFYLYVLIPLSEILIIIYGMTTYFIF